MFKRLDEPLLFRIFLIFGMLISLFLIYEHFSPNASKFCSFGEGLDCGIVNKSPYANLDGLSYLLTIDFGLSIPLVNISGINPVLDFLTTNAFLAFLTLLIIFIMFLFKEKGKDFWFIENKKIMNWIFGILVFSIVYGFYLFLIQHFILKTYCLYCLALDFTIIISLILSWRLKK